MHQNEAETVNRATEPEDNEIVHVASQDISIPLSELKKMLTEERAATIDEIKKLMKSMEEKNATSTETRNDNREPGTDGLSDITETIAEIEDQAVSETRNGGKQRRSRRRRRR